MRFRLTLSPSLFYVIFSLIVLVACKKSLEDERVYSENKSIEDFIQLNNLEYTNVEGVYHATRVTGYGYQVAYDDTVTFWYVGYTLEGKIFETNVKSIAISAKLDTTIRSFEPLTVIAGRGTLISGLDKGLLLSNENELATILFPSTMGFGNNAIGPIKQWSPLAYDIQIVKLNGVNIQKEKAIIENLDLLANGFTDTLGLYYKFLLLGSNSKPIATDTIWGWYKGTLPDGTVIKDLGTGNQKIALSDKSIPVGVRLGFMLTKSGGGITDLVLPSYFGYGINGEIGVVNPYQTLFYQIRLDSIK
jgi:FKBP-type peptidyl-prolyl cis-trans isomerase